MTRGHCWALGPLAALVLWSTLWMTCAARADFRSGQEAFDKGDYAGAMAEWQSVADHGDADAQLGLGKLYEFGLGGLTQSYKRADFWYRKAADQNNGEAQYRLALMWAVGGDDFPPDPNEAYKWLVLVLDSKGIWGTRAAELKRQFDRLAGPSGQQEGKQRAAAWREAHTPKPAETAAAAPAPATSAPSPAPSLPASKCAGWPFPTLPCTEDFPAFPGAQPEKRFVPPIPAQNAVPTQTAAAAPAVPRPPEPTEEQFAKQLTQIGCTAAPGQGAAVSLLCHTLGELSAMHAAGLLVEDNLGLQLAGGAPQLRQGDLIKVQVRAPAYLINLRIDYFSLGGQVLHLWPNSDETVASLGAGTIHVYGEPGAHKVWAAGGAPFGTELITVIATPIPLDLGAARRPIEQADDYLRDLRAALMRAKPPTAATPNIVASLLVHTSAH
jgi:hypothetical protein